MAKSGNTWFKIKRARIKVVGSTNKKLDGHIRPFLKLVNGQLPKIKEYEPRLHDARVPSGLVFVGFGRAKQARREAYNQR